MIYSAVSRDARDRRLLQSPKTQRQPEDHHQVLCATCGALVPLGYTRTPFHKTMLPVIKKW